MGNVSDKPLIPFTNEQHEWAVKCESLSPIDTILEVATALWAFQFVQKANRSF